MPHSFWDNMQSGDQHTVTYQTERVAKDELNMGTAAEDILLYANYH